MKRRRIKDIQLTILVTVILLLLLLGQVAQQPVKMLQVAGEKGTSDLWRREDQFQFKLTAAGEVGVDRT